MTPRPVSNNRQPEPEQSSTDTCSLRKDLDELPADWPEIGYVVFPNGALAPQKGANYAIMQALLMASRSAGSVTIKSADMAVAPVIDPNWFGSRTDVEVMVAGLKRVRQALNSSAMAPIMIGDELLPGPEVQTDEEMALYVAQRGSTLYHAFATNKMGKTSDPGAVVDNRGRVIGVKRCTSSISRRVNAISRTILTRIVRVIDCSAFPFLPPGSSPQTSVCRF
jgi:choline dehydrogenase